MKELKCPECKSTKLTKLGYVWINREKIQRYRCESCGRTTVYPVVDEVNK